MSYPCFDLILALNETYRLWIDSHYKGIILVMTNIKKRFGSHLRNLRVERKLTQEELADRAGMHFTYIGQIERGLRNPSLVNLEKIAKALKIKAGELLPF